MATSPLIEKSDSHDFRSGEKLSMSDILIPWDGDSDIEYFYPCLQRSKKKENKKPTEAELKESLEYIYSKTLNLGNDSCPLEKTKATECKKLPEDFLPTIPCDADSDIEIDQQYVYPRSQRNKKKGKKPTEVEPKESLEYMSAKNVPVEALELKPDEYLDYFPQHYETSFNGIKIYSEVIRPIKKKKPKATMQKYNMRSDEKREDLEDILFRESEGMETFSRIFAGAALSYLREQGCNLELVKPGAYKLGEVTFGYRAHFNFKAKREDDPSAPVEMYFGQLRYYDKTNIVVECCVSMGEADYLPYEPENRGCRYCTNTVHHPLGGCKGIVWGLLTYSPKAPAYYYA